MALRWRKDKRQTGLAGVCAGPRGSGLYDGEKKYASVNARSIGWGKGYDGWYWVAGWDSDVPMRNTCDKPLKTEAEAKEAAMEYVKQHTVA